MYDSPENTTAHHTVRAVIIIQAVAHVQLVGSEFIPTPL